MGACGSKQAVAEPSSTREGGASAGGGGSGGSGGGGRSDSVVLSDGDSRGGSIPRNRSKLSTGSSFSVSPDTDSHLLDDLPDAVIVISQEGVILNANKATMRFFGYAVEELVSQNISMLCPEPHRSRHNGYLQRYLQTGVKRVVGRTREVTGVTKDGELVPIALSVSETIVNGESYFTGIVRDNAQVTKVREDVIASEARAKAVLDASPNGIVVVDTVSSRIQTVNHAITRITGYSESECLGAKIDNVIGKPLSELMGDLYPRHLHADAAATGLHVNASPSSGSEQVKHAEKEVEEENLGTKTMEVSGTKKDGSEFLAEVHVSRIDVQGNMCACLVIEDVTNSRATAVRARAIFEAASDAIITMDANSVILSINPAGVRMLGYDSVDSLVGQNVSVLMDDDLAKSHASYVQRYLDTGVALRIGKGAWERDVKKADGSFIPCELTLSDISIGTGQSSRIFAAIVRDISNRKRAEQARAMAALLSTTLPTRVAERMLKDPTVDTISERLENSTILFTDMVGFTSLSSKMAPHEVTQMLAEIFGMFDDRAEEFGVEKIKTIGDAYMAACLKGISREHDISAMARFALAVIHDIQRYNERHGTCIAIRVGMHIGHVMGAVLSRNKPMLDVFGDACNFASRMESTGSAGRVQLSQDAAIALEQRGWNVELRGEVAVKGKGTVRTYWLIGCDSQQHAEEGEYGRIERDSVALGESFSTPNGRHQHRQLGDGASGQLSLLSSVDSAYIPGFNRSSFAETGSITDTEEKSDKEFIAVDEATATDGDDGLQLLSSSQKIGADVETPNSAQGGTPESSMYALEPQTPIKTDSSLLA
eukprot:ANDGO_07835.mRNA.1 Adenylate cyclase